MKDETRIIDETKSYFFMIPNIVDTMGLSVYAFRLYCHFKRVTGENGVCFQSTTTLAKACDMSTASISRAKEKLAEAGLIRIKKVKSEHGGRDYDEITIVDIWAKNLDISTSNTQVTVSNLQSSPEKLASYPGSIKEEPVKNTPIKKNKRRKVNPSSQSFQDDYSEALHVFSKATGMMAFPGGPDQAQTIANRISATVSMYGLEKAVELSKQAYQLWVSRKNKDGRPYSRTGTGWIDWVLSNDIPQNGDSRISAASEVF